MLERRERGYLIKIDDFFYLLSDETRLRCLLLLVAKGELCVCDLTTILKIIQPKISRHLAILKKFKVVSDRRSGVWIYYRVHPNLPQWIQKILATTLKQLSGTNPYSLDLAMLNSAKNCSTC